MKPVLIALTTGLATISFLLLPASASHKEAPDPVKIQKEIAGYLYQELNELTD